MAETLEKYVPEAFNLSSKLPVNDACEHGFSEPYYSRTNPDTGVLDFNVEGNSEHCLVLNKSFLKVEFEIIGKAARTAAGATVATEYDIGTGDTAAKVVPINNILHSAFEQIEVYANNQITTKADRNYPVVAYYDTLCNYGEHPLHTYFQLSGWYKDDYLQMESNNVKVSKNLENRRGQWCISNKALKGEFIGRICSPLFMQEKVIPPQVTIRVVMKKAKDTFCLMHESGSFELKIKNPVLMVQKVTPVAAIKESYVQLLEEGHPLQYNLRTPLVNYYTIEASSSQFMRDDLFLGKMPKRIILGMVETAAYHGNATLNPFNFQHFNVGEITLYKDGMPYPCPSMRMDFENQKYAEAYHNFMKSLGAAYSNKVPPVKKEEFGAGFFIVVYDMSPDQSGSVQSASMLSMNSNVRLEMKFAKALPKNVTLLVYAEYENAMEITKDRQVIVNL